jgi:hypothetical protein
LSSVREDVLAPVSSDSPVGQEEATVASWCTFLCGGRAMWAAAPRAWGYGGGGMVRRLVRWPRRGCGRGRNGSSLSEMAAQGLRQGAEWFVAKCNGRARGLRRWLVGLM